MKNNLEYIINQYQIEALKQDHTVNEAKVEDLNPHKYFIRFDDPDNTGIDISQSILLRPEENPTKDTVMNKPDVATDKEVEMLKQMKKYQMLEGARQTEKIKFDKTKANFNQGVAIKDVIKQLVDNSDYVTKQLNEFRKKVVEAASETDDKKRDDLFGKLYQPLKWYRIVEKVIPTGKFNKALNVEQQEIYYYIRPVLICDTRAAAGTLAPAADPKKFNMVVKEYFYFFTGLNTEILNLDIDVSLDFFAYKPANPDVAKQGSGDQPKEIIPELDQDNNTKIPPTTPMLGLRKFVPVPGGGKSSPGVGNRTGDRLFSKAVTDSIYDNGAIMNTVSMEIMGDPDLIIQDTVSVDREKFFEFKKQGGIVFSEGEQYIGLHFKTPYDIPDNTGIADSALEADKLSNTTMFDGAYGLMTITSHFKQGKFTQNLSLRRVNDESLVTKNTSVTTKA